jgi:Na+/proline symporter
VACRGSPLGDPRWGEPEVEWDLGLWGIAVLVGMSVAFGVITQVVFWNHATRWLWLIAAAVMFVVGVLVSEVWFGWATGEELQPNIDGLSFDEVLLFASAAGVAAVLLTRAITRRRSNAPRNPGVDMHV